MDNIWKSIPQDILYYHILSKLPIDTKRKLKIKPLKIDLNIINNFNNLYIKIIKPKIFYNNNYNNLEYTSICFFISSFLYIYQILKFNNTYKEDILISNNIIKFWKYNYIINEWIQIK
jgi:hypothetical protein